LPHIPSPDPNDPQDRWIGLPLEPGVERLMGGQISLVAHLEKPIANIGVQGISGLVLEEWDEVVPNATEHTGIAFHFDQPGSRPPQAILLAVHPDGDKPWDLETMEAILLETFELARLRSVDMTSLLGLGHYLPALYYADNVAGDTISVDFRRTWMAPEE
jgi:hypothetical protein